MSRTHKILSRSLFLFHLGGSACNNCDIEILDALPVEGRFRCKTRVLDVIDKGAKTGAMVYWEKAVTDAARGVLVARSSGTTVLRGDGGFGGPARRDAPSAPAPVPEGPADAVVDLATRPEQALYYGQNGDTNPLHLDPAAARSGGFDRPILHGLCTFGLITHAILRAMCDYDPGRLQAMRLRFSAPVMPGDTIRTEIWNNGTFRATALERDVLVAARGGLRLG